MQNPQKHAVLRNMIVRPQHQSESHKRMAQSIKAKMDAKRTQAEKVADWVTTRFGSTGFLTFNLVWFSIWIILNVGLIPGVQPFDPFPFGFLTMIVSLEAIVLAIVVLISQNREAQVAALREEVDVYINFQAEQELTKLLEMVALLLEKQGIATADDTVLQSMLMKQNAEELEKELEDELRTD
jgi:uncharacterized membrane protein